MSKHRRPRRINVPAAGLLFSATAMLAVAPSASAHEADAPLPHLPTGTAAPEFFLKHLDTYHFGRTLLGFTRAAEDPYDWAVYHFATTGLETAARAVSPQDAPEVRGDDWVPTDAHPSTGTGHGPPSHRGHPLRVPVDPAAGPEYLGKALAQNGPAGSEVVPTLQETARRAVTPTEAYPPVKGDNWHDRRPVDDGSSNTVLGGGAADLLAGASGDVVGTATGGAIEGVFGGGHNPAGGHRH